MFTDAPNVEKYPHRFCGSHIRRIHQCSADLARASGATEQMVVPGEGSYQTELISGLSIHCLLPASISLASRLTARTFKGPIAIRV